MSIGSRIAKCRKNLNLSQEELAEKSHITRASIGNYERNDRTPPADILNEIAKALNTAPGYLLTGKESNTVITAIKEIENLIINIQKELLKEGYSNDLIYLKGKLDGLIVAKKILNESEEIQ